MLGSLLGLFATLMKQSRLKILNIIAAIYTQVIRGTPLLVQLYIWLYGLPLIGISLPAISFLGNTYGSREFLTAVVALSINSGAYICELLRGGLASIDKGQMEAGRSLGLSRGQTMKSVIIPQAIRVVLPGLGNEFIMMIKESSIVSVVGIFDVMYTSNIVKAATYSIFEPLIIVALIYFFLTFTLTALIKKLETRLNVYD
jgi:polar amino acid transport system permease protein